MICVCKRDDPAHESQPDGTRVEVRGVAGVWQSGAVQPERFRQSLFVGFVGERDQDQLEHAITKLCDSSEQVTNRRQTMNNYFMAINSAIIGGMAWRALAALDQYGRAADQATSSHWSIVAVSVGIVFVSLGATYLCQVWWCILAQYKKVSRSKIELHEALESKRRVRPFTTQYSMMSLNKYEPLTDLEQLLPKFFQAAYSVSIIMAAFTALSAWMKT